MNDTISRAIKGDAEAILALIQFDEDILYSIAYTYVKNEHDARDALQELTYKALCKMKSVKQPQFARTWLVRVLINCCHDILKKRIHSVEIDSFDEGYMPIYKQIDQLMDHLSLDEQQLIYAKYFQQLKNEEIAAIHQIAEGTVKSRIHYILKKLRKVAGKKEDWL